MYNYLKSYECYMGKFLCNNLLLLVCKSENDDSYRNTASKMPKWGFLSTAKPLRNSERNTYSTIDANDVELFSKQMKDWWNPDGEMGLLHSMNLLR